MAPQSPTSAQSRRADRLALGEMKKKEQSEYIIYDSYKGEVAHGTKVTNKCPVETGRQVGFMMRGNRAK